MEPTREIYWNAPYGIIVDLVGVAIVAYVIYGIRRRCALWHLGQADDRLSNWRRRLVPFIRIALSEMMAHRRLLRARYAGLMHLLIFGGSGILFLASLLVMISHYGPMPFLHGTFYLWFSLIADLGGLAVIVGVSMAAYRRYLARPAGLNNITDDLVMLALILVMVITGFAVEGLRMAETEIVQHSDWARWSPIGWLFAQAFAGLDSSVRLALHRGLWWLHPTIFFVGVIYAVAAFTKFRHMVMAPINAFLRSSRPRGVPSKLDFANAEHFGVSNIWDFTWKDLIDLDTCTRCARCEERCPAALTNKPLSPMKLIQDLRSKMLASTAMAKGALSPKTEDKGGAPVGTGITEEELWACNLCGNCEEACPVYVEHTNKIIDMRRSLVLEQARMPETVQGSLVSVRKRGHPWQGTPLSRAGWIEQLAVPVAESGGDPGILFWVGCTGALQERNVKATMAFARLLLKAGVRFSVLGDKETCCGHFARRLGDELLFQTLAERSIRVLRDCNVQQIVTMCPHGYHTLKNEYPQYGGSFAVIHHTELILQLMKDGKLRPDGTTEQKVTLQDSCYLGRFNGIYDTPRQVLKNLPNIRLVEMKHNRVDALCCGAGGGRMWVDEAPEQRVSSVRFKEAVETNAGTIVAACPFCLQMGEDALRSFGREDSTRAVDLAELVEASLPPATVSSEAVVVAEPRG